MFQRRLAFLLALSLLLVVPSLATQAAAVQPEISFQPDRQILAVPLTSGGVPALVELANPPRLIVDLPGTPVGAGEDRVFPVGRVSRLIVQKVGVHTRVTLYLRQAVHGAWSLGFQDGRLLISLPRLRGEAATIARWVLALRRLAACCLTLCPHTTKHKHTHKYLEIQELPTLYLFKFNLPSFSNNEVLFNIIIIIIQFLLINNHH